MICDAHGLETVASEGCPACVEDAKRRAGLTRRKRRWEMCILPGGGAMVFPTDYGMYSKKNKKYS